LKPADHPEFFRWPAPEGRSRESTIRLDGRGRFWHDDELVTHPKMAQAFATWIARHPDDGRFILTNGYDWTYFIVDDVPFFVKGVHVEKDRVRLVLSDETQELLDPESLSLGENGALYVKVKNGSFEARFTPEAQTRLAPILVGEDSEVRVSLAGVEHGIHQRIAPS
jgi:uncharacterized protein